MTEGTIYTVRSYCMLHSKPLKMKYNTLNKNILTVLLEQHLPTKGTNDLWQPLAASHGSGYII